MGSPVAVLLLLLLSACSGPSTYVTAAATQTVFANSALAGHPATVTSVPAVGGSWSGSKPFSVQWLATLTAPTTQQYAFTCSTVNGAVIMWLDDHLLCGTDELFAPTPAGGVAPMPPFMKLTAGEPHFMRMHFYHNESTTADASLALLWKVASSSSAAKPVPASALSATVPSEQLSRLSMQSNLSTGWATWWRDNALSTTLLPEASTLTLGLCQLSSGVCMDPLAQFTPEQGRGPEEPCTPRSCVATARPGVHAWDRSYWQLYLVFQGVNVSLEWAGTGAGHGYEANQQLSILATVVNEVDRNFAAGAGAGLNRSDFVLSVTGDFKYNRVGTVELSPPGAASSLSLEAYGLRSTTARALTAAASASAEQLLRADSRAKSAAGTASANQTLYLALNGGVAALTTAASTDVPSLASLQTQMAKVKAQAAFRLPASTATTLEGEKKHGSDDDEASSLVEAGGGMQAGLMWNVLWHPTQAGPFVSVSRAFTLHPYEIFEWDTYFGALALSFDERGGLPLALSSLIQVTKGKTLGPSLDGKGFVPGYSKGGRWLSEDRTERPVAALITLTMWRRWSKAGSRATADLEAAGEEGAAEGPFPSWVLRLLYPDLLHYHHWMWAQRRLPPLNLGCAGSDPCFTPPLMGGDDDDDDDDDDYDEPPAAEGGGEAEPDLDGGTAPPPPPPPPPSMWCKESWGMGHLQGARFESLDNSPMYDSPGGDYQLWNASTYRMALYDVGQSAAMASECESLAELAELLGHDADATMFRARAQALGALINEHMWVPELGVYSNVLVNGTAYPRISPTSFYPLLAGLANDTQAQDMTARWITNRSRFCVPVDAGAWPPPTGPPAGAAVNRTCYWGMPSISADDPAYMVAGGTSGIYWRGYTWAPQAFLTYLALKKYAHIPLLASAAKGLCAQQLDLMLSVWRPQHHICENYPSLWVPPPHPLSPDPGGNECTGNHFYIWGGLSAMMALMESGHYQP